MKVTSQQLSELLVAPGHITKEELEHALDRAKEERKDIVDTLVSEGYVGDEQLGRLLAEEADIPFVVLLKEKIDDEVLNLVPEAVARSKDIVAFGKSDEEIYLAMVDPTDLETIHQISKRIGKKVKPYLATKRDMHSALIGIKKA